MLRPRGLGSVLLALVLALTAACSGAGGEGDEAAEAPEGWVVVETEIGSLARPKAWKPAPPGEGATASFTVQDGGETVAQMDVLVNSITPGTKADTVDAAVQSARMTSFPQLEHVRRESTEVAGADSAFVTESTYVTVDSGQPARSLDQVAVAEDGTYLLVRITALQDAYDQALFGQVMGTVQLEPAGTDS